MPLSQRPSEAHLTPEPHCVPPGVQFPQVPLTHTRPSVQSSFVVHPPPGGRSWTQRPVGSHSMPVPHWVPPGSHAVHVPPTQTRPFWQSAFVVQLPPPWGTQRPSVVHS
jgi:hypothetical protein